MVKKKHTPHSRLLTDVELELMNIVWRLKEGTVHEILAHLQKDRELAYTSVSTILRILEQKRILKTRKEGRGHIYIPIVTKEEYERITLNHIVESVFDGTPSTLVYRLIEEHKITPDELESIFDLLEQKEKSK
jgi:predicted transcriptional regulator